MLLGFCAVIQPLARIVSGVGPDGPLVTFAGDSAFWQFVGSCCLFATGVSSVIVGYLECIADWGELTPLVMLILLTQSGFIPYVSDMANVGSTILDNPPQFFMVINDENDDPTAGLINQAKIDEQENVYYLGSLG